MSWRDDQLNPVPVEEALNALNVDHLKPLVALLEKDAPKRKGELVAALVRHLTNPTRVRALYERLEPLARTAVQEATHEENGFLLRSRFEARYGAWPTFHDPDPKLRGYYDDYRRPTLLSLFFPRFLWLPTDLRQHLLGFVPAPPAFALPTVAQLPETVPQKWYEWDGHKNVESIVEEPLRVRETARAAEQDIRAVLRLVEAGALKVTDKKCQPTTASRKAIAGILAGGDFYTEEDQEAEDYDVAADLGIKTFAWPMLVQAAGFAQKSGTALVLSPAGRKALDGSSAAALAAAFRKWRTSTLLDEFSRVEAIKGQGKGGLTALAARRKTVLDGLAACPPGVWFRLDDFFRLLRATDRDFEITRRSWELYFSEHHYGNLGDLGDDDWAILQGRYVLAVFFEYLAPLGLIDVAYVPPQGVRDDYTDRWGADDLSCLSRYDGLLYARINPLGAWCLGLADSYETPLAPVLDVLRVLPNLDIVVTKPPLPAADRLVLDRYAELVSDNTWKLTPAKFATVLEEGGTLTALEELLRTRCVTELPHTVEVFLKDQRERAGRLRDLGTARLIECADATLAQMLAHDPQLRGKCHLAGERWLVFQAQDEPAVRKSLRRLGHVLPAPGG